MRQRTKAKSDASKGATAHTSIPGLDTPVEMRRHPSARRMTLRVSRTKRAVIVTVPMQCNLDDADKFLNRHIDWVRDRVGKLPQPVPFADCAIVPLRGVYHRLRFSGAAPKAGLVELIAFDAAGSGPQIVVHGATRHAARHLRAWLADEARRDLDERVAVHCGKLGLTAKRVVIRDQATRWGSCSTTRVLSFSWRLILAPPFVLDYVAAHEVAHLAEMNHGPRFWALVRKAFADLDAAKDWLSTRGLDLHRYGERRI